MITGMVRSGIVLLGIGLAVASCGTGSPAEGQRPGSAANLPPLKHVFILVMENEGYANTFNANPPAPYLGTTMPAMGALLRQYYGIGHVSLDNYIAMVSGQAPNPVTQSDCMNYSDFQGAVPPGSTDGQAVGSGCVYPAGVKTIGDQLEVAGLTWKQYAEDMALGPSDSTPLPATCRHPPLNSQDNSQGSSATDQYATRHVPFVYFHSIIDDPPRCDAHVVDLNLLKTDLNSAATTPNLVFITPDVCSDGHDATCANTAQPGGYAGINGFLSEWVPRIMNSPAYQDGGMILTIFDEAANSDATACCNEPTGPNSPKPGITGPGGGLVGAVIISQYVKPGTVSDVPYNHYSMLRSLEALFGLPFLGEAGQAGLQPFGTDIFNAGS